MDKTPSLPRESTHGMGKKIQQAIQMRNKDFMKVPESGQSGYVLFLCCVLGAPYKDAFSLKIILDNSVTCQQNCLDKAVLLGGQYIWRNKENIVELSLFKDLLIWFSAFLLL